MTSNLHRLIDGTEPCATTDPELWFPGSGNNGNRAKFLCETSCPVRDACLEYGLENRVTGIWGGKSEVQRNALRKQLGINAKPVEIRVPVDTNCGTEAGYRNHHRKGEKPCEPCRQAESRSKIGVVA